MVDPDYIIEKVKEVVDIKGNHDIEIHIAPYGESLLYPDIFNLIKNLWKIEGISTISMQSNGMLLTPEIIDKLQDADLTRINLSLNTMDESLAAKLCNVSNYNLKELLNSIDLLLNSTIDVLIAPVWFPGVNDEGIEDIIMSQNLPSPS